MCRFLASHCEEVLVIKDLSAYFVANRPAGYGLYMLALGLSATRSCQTRKVSGKCHLVTRNARVLKEKCEGKGERSMTPAS